MIYLPRGGKQVAGKLQMTWLERLCFFFMKGLKFNAVGVMVQDITLSTKGSGFALRAGHI